MNLPALNPFSKLYYSDSQRNHPGFLRAQRTAAQVHGGVRGVGMPGACLIFPGEITRLSAIRSKGKHSFLGLSLKL